MGCLKAVEELIGSRTPFAHFFKGFEQMFLPAFGCAYGEMLGHLRGEGVDGVAEELFVEFLGAVVHASGIEVEVGGEYAAVGGEDVASSGHDDLGLPQQFVGALVPLVGVDYGGVAEFHNDTGR